MSVSGSDREASIMSRPWPNRDSCALRKQKQLVAEQSSIKKKGKRKNPEGRGFALKRG